MTTTYDIATASIITTSKTGDLIPVFRNNALYSLSTNLGNDTGVSILDLGLVDDPNQNNVQANTLAYKSALIASAGNFALIHPANVTVYVTSLVTGTLVNVAWYIYGSIILADSTNSSILDISGWSNSIIDGTGILDGNKSKQSGGYPNALGGIISNTAYTKDTSQATNSAGATITVPPMPVYSSLPLFVQNVIIRGIQITNCFNWPICLGGIRRVCLNSIIMSNSGSSPQFFQNATDSCLINSHIYDITDGGFVFYRGNSYCYAINNNVHDCNDGIGVYAEYDMLPSDTFIGISDNVIYNNADSGIGVTTGLTPPALMQKNILISDNILHNNNTSGRDGGGSIGIVGATGVSIRNNLIYGDGAGATSGTPYSIFIDSTSSFISIEGNQIASAGSASAKGVGIWVSGTNNLSIRNNTFYNLPDAPYMTSGVGGSFGDVGCVYENNTVIGELAGYLDEAEKPANLLLMQRSGADNTLQITKGLNLLTGDLIVSDGILATTNNYGISAEGTSQADAASISSQISIITVASSSENSLLLPSGAPTGAVFTICNRSGSSISVYPPVGGQIEGVGVNTPVTVLNTNNLHIYCIYSPSYSGGQWYGWQDMPANVSPSS